MIKFEEKTTKKLPGITSLFVSFSYKPEIVSILKNNCDVFHYDKVTKIWEVPLTSLSKLINLLCRVDDITLSLLEDQVEKNTDVSLDISKYQTKPFQYQLEGIKYGLTHNRWLLLDAPGLGKSLQLIYLAQELKEKEAVKHCLIICGINTLKENWKKEILKHSSLDCKILGERITKKGKVRTGSVKERLEDLKNPINEFFVITNIETLRNDDIIKELKKGTNSFEMVVVDEIHTCKSPTSQQGKNLLKLKNSKYMIGATGTLLLNNPLDAFVPLSWIGAERATYTNFKYYYCNFGGDFHNILLSFKNIPTLKNMIEKYSLRRTKDLLDLPPKTVIDEYIEMNDLQSTFYNNIKEGVVDQVDLVNITPGNLLAIVSRLRQATACPSILTSEDIASSKIERAVDLTEQIIENGDKVVIFSTFKETLNHLEKYLHKYNPTINTGDIDDSTISKNIDEFQNTNNSKVFLATWQKMGTGITLNSASYAIFIDTPWTSAAFQQAQDRIYRIGTKNPVFIYNLICKDTIDERVNQIVNDKEALADYIVDNKINDKLVENLKKYIEELKN